MLTKEVDAIRLKRDQILQDHNVLNLAQEEPLNNILKLAVFVCKGSHAVLTFVDSEYQWMKSAIGFKVQKIPTDAMADAFLVNDVNTFSRTSSTSPFLKSSLLESAPDWQNGITIAIRTQTGYPLGYILILTEEKTPFPVEQISMLHILKRQVMAEILVMVNVTVQSELLADLQFMYQELQIAKDIAEAANARKSKVLAYVCHEFKNPLSATMMFGNSLERGSAGKLTGAQSTYVQNMMSGCQQLRELVTDILDIAPIEAGLFKLKITPISIKAMLGEVVDLMAPAAAVKKIKIKMKLTDIEGIEADAKRIRQILINLLSNAIKYTKKGDTILIKTEPSQDAISITVEDHGPGISEADLEQLFQDYYRVQNQLRPQAEGLGLGLALCKTLVELHGGTIKVESEIGVGTRFIVTLPCTTLKS